MDLCQESETDLENNENNEIQSTEEAELAVTCPDDRSERNHVCCLLNISDITLEEDGRANEFVIGTGWEEAVQGWGKTSPTACVWPRKKLKKARIGESSSSSCLFCLSLSQGSLEARSPLEAGKWEAGAAAEVGVEKNWSSPSQIQGPVQGPPAAPKDVNKPNLPADIHGEKKSLQVKEFIWCMEDWAIPDATAGGKAPRSPSRGADGKPCMPDSLTSKALIVLPPLKASPPNASDVVGKKSKSFFWQSEGKVLRVEKEECVARAYGLKTVDGKGEKRQFELAKPLKVANTPPCPPPVARASLLPDSKQCCLRFSLLPEKSLACPPNASNVRYLATLHLLEKRAVQGYKAKFKAKEPRHTRSTQKPVLTETKPEDRPPTLETKVFSRPLLPSLTHRKKKIK